MLGKTILSTRIAQDILAFPPAHCWTAYFAFDFKDESKRRVDNMLRSLIFQLSVTRHTIREPLSSLYKKWADGISQPSTHDLISTLMALAESCSRRMFIVLDALDECEDRQVLLDSLSEMSQYKCNKLNVIMTSQKIGEIEGPFHSEIQNLSELPIEDSIVDEDIRSFVRDKLQNDRRFKTWKKYPDVQRDIEDRLMEKANGM